MIRTDAPGTIFAFILGVSVGALAALFLAPKAGRELRADIAAGVSDEVDQLRSTSKHLSRRAQKIVALAQDHVKDALEAGQNAYNQANKA